jgi:DNA-binding NtrC family response regulator
VSSAILIIEDEATLAKNIATYLKRSGYDASVAATGEDGLAQFETLRPDAVLLDYALPGCNGLEVLKRLKELDPRLPVLMMTGHGSEVVAVEAMKAGACDYLIKPVILSELKLRLEQLVGREKRDEELTWHRRRLAAEGGLDHLIGRSAPMVALKASMRRLLDAERGLADADLPAVLITGDTGTGKELVARALHFDGIRREQPFVELNCSTIPADLLEAELFGYERGAFTDAKQRKLGLVEAADGGTLFLDEIGDIDPRVQSKLLKLLEDKTVRRLGSVREERANVRIVTATNRDLEEAVRDGHFRADLLFRLRIVHFDLPPLRARGDDVLLLAQHYLGLQRARYRKPQLGFAPEAEAAMQAYSWPGNVRELRNAIERAVVLARGPVIEVDDLPQRIVRPAMPLPRGRGESVEPLDEIERRAILGALERLNNNKTHTARALGISLKTLHNKLKRYTRREAS